MWPTVLAPEQNVSHPLLSVLDHLYYSCAFRSAGEQTQNLTGTEELGRGVVSQHVGEWCADRNRPTIGLEETETRGSAIHQSTKLRLRVPKGLLYPPARRHLASQVHDLLPERHDLIDKVLLGSVLIAHGSF
jgi:hypothetical protein